MVIVARSEEKMTNIKEDLETQYDVQVTVIATDLSLPHAVKGTFSKTEQANIENRYPNE